MRDRKTVGKCGGIVQHSTVSLYEWVLQSSGHNFCRILVRMRYENEEDWSRLKVVPDFIRLSFFRIFSD